MCYCVQAVWTVVWQTQTGSGCVFLDPRTSRRLI